MSHSHKLRLAFAAFVWCVLLAVFLEKNAPHKLIGKKRIHAAYVNGALKCYYCVSFTHGARYYYVSFTRGARLFALSVIFIRSQFFGSL